MQAIPDQFGRFPLASSPLANIRLSVLAYLAVGPDTVANTAEACGVSRMQTNRIVSDFLDRDFLVTGPRHRYAITPRGKSELVSIHAELSLVLRQFEDRNKKGTAA